MSLEKLIQYFKDKKEFPIDVKEVKEWLIREGFQDEINFYPTAEVDPKILRGLISQYTKHTVAYGQPVMVSDIGYSKQLNPCWVRFICCKELMHILDDPNSRTATLEEISQLTFDLTTPFDGKCDSPAMQAEYKAILSALRVLAPINAVNELRDAYLKKTKNDFDIAFFFRIPQVYVSYIMSEEYKVFAKSSVSSI